MLNNSYFIIYNNSFDMLYNNLKFYINENKKDFKKDYELKNSKKITGYMLFVREYYKLNKNNEKKEIFKIWKHLEDDKKEKYNDEAKKILNFYNKMINKKSVKKKIEKIEIIDEDIEIIEEDIEINYNIKKIEIDNKIYYVDYFMNIIDINTHKYNGYIKNNKIYNINY